MVRFKKILSEGGKADIAAAAEAYSDSIRDAPVGLHAELVVMSALDSEAELPPIQSFVTTPGGQAGGCGTGQ